jgi:hypothetical protein
VRDRCSVVFCDAFLIGIAAAHQIEYLLTWNCKHIANATMRGTVEDICRSAGPTPPIGLHARGAAKHGFDVDRIATTIRKHEHDSTEPVIRESPKRATRQKKAS